MTAERLVARPYGALELKQTYQQGLWLGLLAAALLHVGALWGLSVYGGLASGPPVVSRVPRLLDEGRVRVGPPIKIEEPLNMQPQDKYVPPVRVNQTTGAGIIVIVDDDLLVTETLTPKVDQPSRTQGERATPGGSGTGTGSTLGIDVGVVPDVPEFGTYVFVTREPEPLPNQPPPEYSEIARLMEAEGTVVLSLLISESGEVVDVRPLNREGTISPLLVELAMAAAREWRFIPALQHDRHVSVWFNQAFKFSLK